METKDEKPILEAKTCPTCRAQFLTEGNRKQCEKCQNDGKVLLNE